MALECFFVFRDADEGSEERIKDHKSGLERETSTLLFVEDRENPVFLRRLI